MDFGRPVTTTEARALIGMVHPDSSIGICGPDSILAHLTEAASGPVGRKILWNDALESSFKELKCMVSLC